MSASRETTATVTSCPTCGKRIGVPSLSVMTANHPLGPGDVSLCIRCQTPLRFAEDMTARVITRAELDELPADLQDTLVGLARLLRAFAAECGPFGEPRRASHRRTPRRGGA